MIRFGERLTVLFVFVVGLQSGNACWAQAERPLADRVAAIKKDHADLEKWFHEALVDARRDEKKVHDANEKYREGILKHAAVLRPLIKEHPTDPAAFDAVLVLAGEVNYPLDDQIAQIVLDHHLANPNMGQLCFDLRHRGREESARKIMEAAAEKHPQKSVRGQATFALGDSCRLIARPFGPPPPKDVSDLQLGKAESYYRQVLENFDDFTTPDGKWNLGKRAEHELARLSNLPNLQVGRPAPPIVGTDLEGKPLKLEDYRGKVVVVVFWGSWCGPCMAKVPHERELHARLREKPFALLGVSCGDTLELAKETAKKHQMEWSCWWDGDETRTGPIQTDYDIQHWPSVFVIDAEGTIRAVEVHGMELDEAVDSALARLNK